jgi:hypothetical protein
MSLQLRPANLGEILDRTATLYRMRFLVFVGIGAVPAGGVLFFAAGGFLLSARITSSDPATAGLLALAIVVLVLIAVPVCLALTALGSGALSFAASQAFLGERITIRGAYGAAWRRGWRYVGLLALQILFLAVIPCAAWVLIVAGLAVLAALSRRSGAALLVDFVNAPAGLLLIVGAGLVFYFFWMLLRLCLAFSASVVEQIGVWASLKRATLLSKGTRGRILVLYLLCMVLGWIVSLVLTVPAMTILSLIPQMNTPQHQQTLGALFLFLLYAATFASQAFTKPVSGIAMMLFYYDQRIRKEAFDIEWMMREAGMVGEPSAADVIGPAAGAAPGPALGDSHSGEPEASHVAGPQHTGE